MSVYLIGKGSYSDADSVCIVKNEEEAINMVNKLNRDGNFTGFASDDKFWLTDIPIETKHDIKGIENDYDIHPNSDI